MRSLGFEDLYISTIQSDDPTEDFMLAFMKPINEENKINLKAISLNDAKKEINKTTKLNNFSSASSYYRSTEWMIVKMMKIIGTYMNHTPYYRFPFMSCIKLYWVMLFRHFRYVYSSRGLKIAITDHGFSMNVVIGTVLTFLFSQAAIISLPIKLLLKEKIEYEQLLLLSNTKITSFENIDSRIRLLNSVETLEGYVILIDIPRHLNFTPTIINLCLKIDNVKLIEISGQKDDILVEISGKGIDIINNHLKNKDYCKILYTYQYPVEDLRIYASIIVDIQKLFTFVKEVSIIEGIEIVQIYDFLGV